MSDTDSIRRSRLIGALLAAPFLLMGAFTTGIGLGWIPYDSTKVHAPGWVVALAGLVFVCGGLEFLNVTWVRDERRQSIFVPAMLIGITLVCNWVAFGDGERRFTTRRTASINRAIVESRPIDEYTGRVVFGIGAVSLDVVLAALAVKYLRKSGK